jgi:hypothetical protein
LFSYELVVSFCFFLFYLAFSDLAFYRGTAGNPARGYAESLRNPPLLLRRRGASDTAPTPTGVTELICNQFPIFHRQILPFLLSTGQRQNDMNGAMTRSTFTVLKLIAGGTFSVWPFVGVLIGNTEAALEPIVR